MFLYFIFYRACETEFDLDSDSNDDPNVVDVVIQDIDINDEEWNQFNEEWEDEEWEDEEIEEEEEDRRKLNKRGTRNKARGTSNSLTQEDWNSINQLLKSKAGNKLIAIITNSKNNSRNT